ncbi:Gfo/Idh/MocA family oxidoreductase [Candidatus Babeliales bacterium]|nr:Gfo/Idh/MocA family oxidoreductase [Candidatus Babeliales bacterium]
MVKLGIIGLGHMGGYHLSASKLITSLELVAIADPNEENWKKVKQSNVLKAHNYQDWIDKVDGVIIAVPTQFHFSITKDCLLRSKHVLVEKPITKNLQEAKTLFKIAQDKKRALHIGHVERFNGAIQELKKIIQNPFLIECYRVGPFASRVQKDSVILDLMIHDLDLITNLVNSNVKIINVIANKIQTEKSDLGVVQLGFENGTIANIISSRISQTKQRTMLIHQKNSFIKLDFTTQDISIYKNTSDSVKIGTNQLKYKQEGTIERLFVYKDNPLKLEIENFIKSIKTGKKLYDIKNDITALSLTLKIEKMVEEQFNDCGHIWNRKPTTTSMQKSTCI